MENFEIIRIKLTGIIECIKEYTSEPTISNIIDSLSSALLNREFDVILFLCKEIKEWYQNNIRKILENEYVDNKNEHEKNIAIISNIIDTLESNEQEYKKEFDLSNKSTTTNNFKDSIISNMIDRFHQVVIQLRDRHDDRDTLDVDDEYDVQDLLHALLKIYCDDIRPEEWTPSYAGTASRQDFLLKNEQIVLETKKTRKGLSNKELANELIIDMERYKTHPDCKKLICFVYDPENRIKNPRGFEKDLSKTTDKLIVKVYIRP